MPGSSVNPSDARLRVSAPVSRRRGPHSDVLDILLYMATIYSMKTTVYLNPEDYRRLKALAKERGRPVAELVREAVAEYAVRHAKTTGPVSIGVGHSGRGDVSERAEEFLDGMGVR